jgi:hypothetical protein
VNVTSGQIGQQLLTRILCLTSASQKGVGANYQGIGGTLAPAVTSSVNTNADVPIVFSIQRATASEAINLEGYTVVLYRKAL